MNPFELYASQLHDALEAEYRTPEFEHRAAYLSALRGLLHPFGGPRR